MNAEAIWIIVTCWLASVAFGQGHWTVQVTWEGKTNWTYPTVGEDPTTVEQISGVDTWVGNPNGPVMTNETGLPGLCSMSAAGHANVHIEWVGISPAPPTIKLFVWGIADAGAHRASNQLAHPMD